jgi:hypothetical protein
MKKLMIGLLIVGVVAAALGTAGYVYAQSVTPPAPFGRGNGFGMGNGMGGGRGMMRNAAGNGQGFTPGEGPMHDEMVAAMAEKLGMSAEELDARIDKGETMVQVATSKGFTADEFFSMMSEARAQAVDQAVKDGKITQEQADWMKQHGPGQMGGGRGRGMGQGRNGNPGCPYTTPSGQ